MPPQIAEIWGLDREPARVAGLLNALGHGCEVFVTPMFFFHSTVEYLTYSKSEHQLYLPGTNVKGKSEKGKIAVVVLQPAPQMNLWYLRDDDGKRFYKWWNQRYKMETAGIRSSIRAAYGSHPQMMKTSDFRMLKLLREKYPEGRFVDLQTFGVFLFKP